MAWIILGAVACLFCYVMGYVIRGKIDDEELKQTRGQMEIDEDDRKELKIKYVEPEKNDSEEN